jgi:hypothetical protein
MNATNKDLNVLLNQIKSSAKKRNILFDLTVVDLNELSFPLTCPALGMPLKFNTGGPKDDSYSVDRIDSRLGYTVDNIIIISYRANVLKNNATLEELKMIVDFYQELAR